MALNAAANLAERISNSVPTTIRKGANPADNPEVLADPSGQTMRALVWKGVNDVRMEDVPKPRVVDDDDVVLEITGTTVCGSDLHLYHGALLEMTSGFILGHEFCGRVAEMGPKVTKFRKGQRVVVSFQIACGNAPESCFEAVEASKRELKKLGAGTDSETDVAAHRAYWPTHIQLGRTPRTNEHLAPESPHSWLQ